MFGRKAKVGKVTVTKCKYCPLVIQKQNLFAKLPVIGKYLEAFPVFFCGSKEPMKLIPSASNFEGVPSWCPHVV